MVLKMNQNNVHNKQDPRTFTILDDCLYDDKWSRDKLMRLIFMNGRHWKIMLMISMQYPLGVPPILRTNIDFVFIFREPVRKNRERLYENYAGMFPTFETFNQIMDKLIGWDECLVIDNTVESNNWQDRVYLYKAELHEDYRLCNDEYWDKLEINNL